MTFQNKIVNVLIAVSLCLLAISGYSNDKHKDIFGKNWNLWQIMDKHNKQAEGKITKISGRSLISNKNELKMIYNKELTKGDVIILKFRLTPMEQALGYSPCSITLQTGIHDVNNDKEKGVSTCVSYDSARKTINWNILTPFIKDIKDRKTLMTYRGQFNPLHVEMGQSLSWPNYVSRQIESYISTSIKPIDRQLTLRTEFINNNKVRIYLNGNLLKEINHPKLSISGKIRILLYNTQVFMVKLEKLDQADSAFVKVDLTGSLNANEIDKKKIKKFANSKKSVKIAGIPFLIPETDSQGNNHIDIGKSWFPEGVLSGMAGGHRGGTSGRWPDPLISPPYRLQFKLPKGPYKAIHILAASDTDSNSIQNTTFQVYRPLAGFPENFKAKVPFYTKNNIDMLKQPISLSDGSAGNLFLVTIPIDPGKLNGFKDLDAFCLELTKNVQLYRSYPDPMYYSKHAAGLPSAVHVFGMTLEKPEIDVKLNADAYGNVGVAPQKPAYTVTLKNLTDKQKNITLTLTTTSYYNDKKEIPSKTLILSPKSEKEVSFKLNLTKYGYYDIKLKVCCDGDTWTEKRTMAYLHPETREKGNWQTGKGPIFGFWQWGEKKLGAHVTPLGFRQTYLMALAGAETQHRSIDPTDKKLMDIAEKYNMVDFRCSSGLDIYAGYTLKNNLNKMSEEKALNLYVKKMEKIWTKSDSDNIHKFEYVIFFPEPNLGSFTYGIPPLYRGEEKVEKLDPVNEKKYEDYLKAFLIGSKAIKNKWPGTKTFMPWGDPVFPILFLRRSEEFKKTFDGIGVDIPGFEHLPEKQLHQVAVHRLYILKNELKKSGKENIDIALVEGAHSSDISGSLTPEHLADQTVRNLLLMMSYGVNRFPSTTAAFECADYWGEQHYGGGVMNRIPFISPKPVYATFATMTRNLNRCNFSKWLPTGSLSVYCLEFKHYKTGKPIYVMWTLRGKRKITLKVDNSTEITVNNDMDNSLQLSKDENNVSFTISSAPCYINNAGKISQIILGSPDHSDVKQPEYRKLLSNIGNGQWKLSSVRDKNYENSFKDWVKRYPCEMSVNKVTAPATQGGKALAIHYNTPNAVKFMPYYTTLIPGRPITIPGRASGLGLWVKGTSDWGRVIYVVRDAKGEKWISIGSKGAWNCDDVHCYSFFNFDGWRYLSFELPSSAPYDNYLENGMTWWGSYSSGDKIVDLPLKLEKIIVERRSYAMYVNSPKPTSKEDVLLADLYAEYITSDNMTTNAEKLSRTRMPISKELPLLENPIAQFNSKGELPSTEITGIRVDDHIADGTRCYIDFKPVEKIKSYDVWVSRYPDGRGAIKLGKNWNAPGKMIWGLKPNSDFYAFIVYRNPDKQISKPSKPFKIHLKDMFGMK